ncbi:MAG: hypothetical protein LBU70_04095 [Chitinispirillales bacterium]|nr:hypothetical protein [Chitinispirillales bacterium]
MSGKFLKSLIIPLAFAALLLCPLAATADAIHSPRVFTRGSFVYIVEPQRIAFLSMDTRSSHTIYAVDDSVFAIVSAVRSGDVIWASNAFGAVIAVDMQTGTVEEFGRGLVGSGQIDVDRRFVWIASGSTLYRMDLTTREWVSIPIPGHDLEVRGIISFNDRIHIITDNAVFVFNTASNDWVTVPHRNFVLGGGDFHKLNELAMFTRGRRVYRYDPSRRTWNSITTGGQIRAVDFAQERLIVGTANRTYGISGAEGFILVPQAALPILRNIYSIALHNWRDVFATERGLAFHNSGFDFDFVPYPNHMNIDSNVFIFSYGGHIILYTGNNFVFYNSGRRLWSDTRILSRGGERRQGSGVHTWDENGTHLGLVQDFESTVSGGLTANLQPTATHSDLDGLITDLGEPGINATINVRTESASGRILDLTIDNAHTTLPPQKGFYYLGIDGDILDRASFGVQSPGIAASNVIPDGTLTEGVSAFFSGNANAPNRNRAVVSATAGGGHLLSKTEWRSFRHERSSIYHLHIDGGREPVASTVKMYVDGIPLSESDFIYNPSNRTVRLLRREKADQTSIIQISFSAKALPDVMTDLEPFPENHFGRYGFVEGAVSPRSWLSARAGVLALHDGAEDGTVSPTIFAGLPVELRSGTNRSLLFHPEVAYDNLTGAHSAAMAVGVRERRAFGSYSGFWAARDFEGIDRRTFENRDMNGEHNAEIGYDIRDNLRASWRQFHRYIGDDALSHFELRTSFIGQDLMPSIEASASSRTWDTGDRSRRDAFTLRLFDPSSRVLGEMNRIGNVAYDLSWTEFQNDDNERGRTIYGTADISPVSRLTLTGSTMYRLNLKNENIRSEISPSVGVYAHGLPRGIDIGARHIVHLYNYNTGSSFIRADRYLYGYFYPGEYVSALENIILYARYTDAAEAYAPPTISPLKYAFLTDERTTTMIVREEFGIIYFPMDNLLLSTINVRHNEHQIVTYTTRERAKLWLENGNSIEGSIGIRKNPTWLELSADALYEHKWSDNFLTGFGAFGTRSSENDNYDYLYGGPMLIASLSKDLSGFIRNIENSHILRITAGGTEAAKPYLDYAFYIRLKIPPNISLVGEFQLMAIEAVGGDAGRVSAAGGFYLHAGF